jgi:hypothetical protein
MFSNKNKKKSGTTQSIMDKLKEKFVPGVKKYNDAAKSSALQGQIAGDAANSIRQIRELKKKYLPSNLEKLPPSVYNKENNKFNQRGDVQSLQKAVYRYKSRQQ